MSDPDSQFKNYCPNEHRDESEPKYATTETLWRAVVAICEQHQADADACKAKCSEKHHVTDCPNGESRLHRFMMSRTPESEVEAELAEGMAIVDAFKKADVGKPRPDLIPADFLLEMGRVMAYGAAKYDVDNWRQCEDPRRYEAAAMRHWLAYMNGEELDPESEFAHLAHCACSIAMVFALRAQDAEDCAVIDERADEEDVPWKKVKEAIND